MLDPPWRSWCQARSSIALHRVQPKNPRKLVIFQPTPESIIWAFRRMVRVRSALVLPNDRQHGMITVGTMEGDVVSEGITKNLLLLFVSAVAANWLTIGLARNSGTLD